LAFADNGTTNAAHFIFVGGGNAGHVDLTNITFGALTNGNALAATYHGSIGLFGTNSQTGSMLALLSAGGGGAIDVQGTVAGSSSITFSTGAAVIQGGGIIQSVTGSTFTGYSGVSGPRCFIDSLASPDLLNPNSVFPGSTDCVMTQTHGAI